MRGYAMVFSMLAVLWPASSICQVNVTAHSTLKNGWMAGGWGSFRLEVKNQGSQPVRLVRWTARWKVADKPMDDPWGEDANETIAPGASANVNTVTYFPKDVADAARPGNAVVSGTAFVNVDGREVAEPFQFEVPAAVLPVKLRRVSGRYAAYELMETRFCSFTGRLRILKWLDQSVAAMRDLTGYTPFGGNLMVIRECPAHPYWAYAGNPVVLNTDYVGKTVEEIDRGLIPFGWIHEIGHNFDDPMGKWYIWSGPCAEFQANFKLAYALETIPDRSFRVDWQGFQTPGMPCPKDRNLIDGRQFTESFFLMFGDAYLADPKRTWDSMSSDEMHSLFQRIQRVYGWGAFKGMYRAYARFEKTGLKPPENSEGKVQLLVAVLNKQTNVDFVPLFQRWRFPVTAAAVEKMRTDYKVD